MRLSNRHAYSWLPLPKMRPLVPLQRSERVAFGMTEIRPSIQLRRKLSRLERPTSRRPNIKNLNRLPSSRPARHRTCPQAAICCQSCQRRKRDSHLMSKSIALHLHLKYNPISEGNHFWEMTSKKRLQALFQNPVCRKKTIVLLPITTSRHKSTENEMTIQLRRLLDERTDRRSTAIPFAFQPLPQTSRPFASTLRLLLSKCSKTGVEFHKTRRRVS